MPRRPWPLVVLAVLQILSPLMSVWISATVSKESFGRTFYLLWVNSDFLGKVDFFLIPLAMAILVYRLSRPSFMALIGLCLYNMFANYVSWRDLSNEISALWLIGVNAFSLLMVAYLLIPQVRIVFWEPRLRWWESKPRYLLSVPVKVTLQKGAAPVFCDLKDLSQGGCCIEAPSQSFAMGDVFHLDFTIQGLPFSLCSEVAYVITGPEGRSRYGLRFLDVPLDVSWDIEAAIDLLRKNHAPRSRQIAPWGQDLKDWVRVASRDPKAWVPRQDRPPVGKKSA